MSKIKEIVLCLAIISIGALLGGSLYDSIVLAPNFRVGIPQSLEHLRQFMAVGKTGGFFFFFLSLMEILNFISFLFRWESPAGRRRWGIFTFVFIFVGGVSTF